MKLKIAIFKGLRHGSTSVFECDAEGRCWADQSDDYSRVTETVEVDFTELSSREQAERELAFLDKKEAELRAEFQRTLDHIIQRRADLLALPAPTE